MSIDLKLTGEFESDDDEKEFLMDFSVHKVAKYFRLLGYDTLCDKNIAHKNLVSIAAASHRTLITCSGGLFEAAESHNRRVKRAASRQTSAPPCNRRVVAYDSDGASIYSTDSEGTEKLVNCVYVQQWRSQTFNAMMIGLIKQLRLRFDNEKVFSLCVTCNETLVPTSKSSVEHRVEPKIYEMYNEFTECPICKKVFWGFDGETVVNYKSFRTLELLRSLCRAAGVLEDDDTASNLYSLKSFRSFPRYVKTCILSFLDEDDLDNFVEVFPVLKELINDVKLFVTSGVPVRPFREIKNC